MNRKWWVVALGLSIALSAGPVSAGNKMKHRFTDSAKVVDVQPIYKTIKFLHPKEMCWKEQVTHHEPRPGRNAYTGVVMGGIIGGVVGNQFGRGDGKKVMTVAGTLLGASIGNDISQQKRRGRYYTTVERRCEVEQHYSYEEKRVGYRVKYRYKGNIFETRTKTEPGKRIRVAINIRPLID